MKTTKIKIWTYRTAPFRLGGTHEAIIATVTAEESFEVNGYTLHVVKSPRTGHYHVAEGQTGALIGYGRDKGRAIAQVVADIAQAAPGVIDSQIIEAKKIVKGAKLIKPTDFWHALRLA